MSRYGSLGAEDEIVFMLDDEFLDASTHLYERVRLSVCSAFLRYHENGELKTVKHLVTDTHCTFSSFTLRRINLWPLGAGAQGPAPRGAPDLEDDFE